jgi:hypothetical protein
MCFRQARLNPSYVAFRLLHGMKIIRAENG